ncbi:MAG: hypothetical protein IJ064_02660 [Bacteroidaceae bacterium]|nr:hypothetical protein [Bacteroidaceae bacterium]
MLSQSSLEAFRQRVYRNMLLLDTDTTASIQDLTHFWDECSAMARQCLTALEHLSSSPRPVGRVALSSAECIALRAQLLLTALVALQVGIRDYALIDQVVTRSLALLPQLKATRLRTHLLVHLYGETEDEALYTQLQDALTTFHPETEEDQYILQTIQIMESDKNSVYCLS